MSYRHFSKMSYVALEQTFFRQLCKLSSRFEDPKFSRRLKDILERCFEGLFYHYFGNYLAKMSKNCFCKMSYIPLYEMSFRRLSKISSIFANPPSFRRLKDILPTFFFLLLTEQLVFSRETIKVSGLLCLFVLFLELKLG